MKIDFHWIGGSTFVISTGELKIACDPVLCKKGTLQDFFWFRSVRLEDPVYSEETFSGIDIWLITHNHEDHLDGPGLSKMDEFSTVICNPGSAKRIGRNPEVLRWKESKILSVKGYEIIVEAIPAIHGVNPVSAFFAGNVNGYHLTISRGAEKVRIYITGDTVYRNKVVNSLKQKETDMFIPYMGAAKQGSWIMTLTLNTAMLRKLIAVLDPKIVIPVHFGTFEHYREPVSEIQKLQNPRIVILKPGDLKSLFI